MHPYLCTYPFKSLDKSMLVYIIILYTLGENFMIVLHLYYMQISNIKNSKENYFEWFNTLLKYNTMRMHNVRVHPIDPKVNKNGFIS